MLVAPPDTQAIRFESLLWFRRTYLHQPDPMIVTNRTNRNISPRHSSARLRGTRRDNGGNDVEWRNATSNALYRLEGSGFKRSIPPLNSAGVAVGNHDNSTDSSGVGTTTFYNQYFGEAHFSPYKLLRRSLQHEQ